jgi:hypothetical protein
VSKYKELRDAIVEYQNLENLKDKTASIHQKFDAELPMAHIDLHIANMQMNLIIQTKDELNGIVSFINSVLQLRMDTSEKNLKKLCVEIVGAKDK